MSLNTKEYNTKDKLEDKATRANKPRDIKGKYTRKYEEV